MEDAFRSDLEAAKVRIQDLEDRVRVLPRLLEYAPPEELARMAVLQAKLDGMAGNGNFDSDGYPPSAQWRMRGNLLWFIPPLLLACGAGSNWWIGLLAACSFNLFRVLLHLVRVTSRRQRVRAIRKELAQVVAAARNVEGPRVTTIEDAHERVDELEALLARARNDAR